jgi:4-amino-4-deoxy-L-arabinose transferase-like glycosyltransferase
VSGVTTGLIGAALPYRFLKEIRWDAALAGAVSVVLVLLTTRWWRTREPSLLATFLVGLAWGLGMMCSANLLPVFLVVVLLFALAAHRRNHPRPWRLIVTLSAGVLLAIAPWTIRNYRELHAVMFMRSNFGLEFSLSNNPDAHVLGAVLENAHHDGVLLAREVEEEVFAGQLDPVERVSEVLFGLIMVPYVGTLLWQMARIRGRFTDDGDIVPSASANNP